MKKIDMVRDLLNKKSYEVEKTRPERIKNPDEWHEEGYYSGYYDALIYIKACREMSLMEREEGDND